MDVLTEAVEGIDPRLKFYVVKALNRLHKDYPSLGFDDEAVHAALLVDTKVYYEIACTLHLNDWGDHGSGHLLKRALIERQEQNLERIFRLLGLRYPSKDIYTAYQGIVSPRKALRASAIEFLDNVLKGDTKRYLLPILDQVSQEELIRKGNELFGIELADAPAALRRLLDGRDPWIKACALYFAIENYPREFAADIARAAGDPDPVVKETATLAGKAA